MFIYFCVYIGMFVGMCITQPHVEARVQLLEVSSLLPLHMIPGTDLSHEAWPQALLPINWTILPTENQHVTEK